MFTVRRLLTALAITVTASGSAFAAQENAEVLHLVTDAMVSQSVYETTSELEIGVTYDVLTTSHQYDPEEENGELVADVKISINDQPSLNDNNDA